MFNVMPVLETSEVKHLLDMSNEPNMQDLLFNELGEM